MTDPFRKNAGNAFHAVLKPLGFKKHGLTWQRFSGMFVDLIDLQASRFDRSFAVNIGVGIENISNQLFFKKNSMKCAADGLVEQRLGYLLNEGKDYWWAKDRPVDILDVAEKLRLSCPAFFEKYHDTNEMIQSLEAAKHDTRLTFPKSFYLALLHIEFGDKQKGCNILREIALRPPAPWNEPALALLHKHSCV